MAETMSRLREYFAHIDLHLQNKIKTSGICLQLLPNMGPHMTNLMVEPIDEFCEIDEKENNDETELYKIDEKENTDDIETKVYENCGKQNTETELHISEKENNENIDETELYNIENEDKENIHKVKNIKCEVCDKTFTRADSKLRHMRNTHFQLPPLRHLHSSLILVTVCGHSWFMSSRMLFSREAVQAALALLRRPLR